MTDTSLTPQPAGNNWRDDLRGTLAAMLAEQRRDCHPVDRTPRIKAAEYWDNLETAYPHPSKAEVWAVACALFEGYQAGLQEARGG